MVIKAVGAHLEHKTEVGGVVLNVRTEAEAGSAAERLAKLSDTLLVEEMITDGVAEILIGVIVDPQFGQVLVLGAGRRAHGDAGGQRQPAAALDARLDRIGARSA